MSLYPGCTCVINVNSNNNKPKALCNAHFGLLSSLGLDFWIGGNKTANEEKEEDQEDKEYKEEEEDTEEEENLC